MNPGITQTESACRTPGVTIYDDNTGDATDQQAGHDVQKMSVAEPYLGPGVSKLVFTLKVRSLATVPPNTTWPIGFTDQMGGARCVAMQSDAAARVSFVFGSTASCAQGPTAGAVTPLDPASNYSADGTITLCCRTARSASSRRHADELHHARPGRDAGRHGDHAGQRARRRSGGQRYTLVGNAACTPNNRPTARLTASPASGFAPLTTTLDGSGSTDPDSDSIASYTFNFGDGSPLVKTDHAERLA